VLADPGPAHAARGVQGPASAGDPQLDEILERAHRRKVRIDPRLARGHTRGNVPAPVGIGKDAGKPGYA
jgi:hypothetical protein